MFTVKITKEAIEYMMFLTNAGTEIDAEEFLQTAISMCRIEAAQQNVQRTGLAPCPECGGVGYHKRACKFGVL